MALTMEDRPEFERRLARVRGAIAAAGYDGLLVVDHDNIHGAPRGDTRYLTNFSAGDYNMAVIVPAEGEPTLVVSPGPMGCTPDWAATRSWITDIRSSSSEVWPPPKDIASDIVTALKDRGLERGRIGYCGRGFAEEKGVQEQLPHATFIAAETVDQRGVRRGLMEQIRAVKSPWEVAYLTRAQACTEIGLNAFLEAARPGNRNTEAVVEGERAAIRAGADEAFVFMSAGTHPWVWGFHRGDMEFREGDLVSVEFNARVNGYVAQIARGIVIGASTAEQQLVLDTGRESQRRMIEALVPGVTGGELWDIGIKVVHDAGLIHYGRYGHGMGISISEAMDIMPGDGNVVEEGHCIEVHAGIFSPRTRDSVLFGDQFILQGGRAVPLSELAARATPTSTGAQP